MNEIRKNEIVKPFYVFRIKHLRTKKNTATEITAPKKTRKTTQQNIQQNKKTNVQQQQQTCQKAY